MGNIDEIDQSKIEVRGVEAYSTYLYSWSIRESPTMGHRSGESLCLD
jgi:hypothetical protein